LQLEELESRALLSASAAAAGLTAQPDLSTTPLGASPGDSSGGYTYYTPAEIRQAYGISQTTLPNGQPATGAGQTIAVVDAYHDPNIPNDLATFDAGYGLAAPPSFRVAQMGGVTQTNSGWAGETALDVEWAHAVAPGANLLLVETPTNNYSDLLAGVNYAASQPGVVAVSMSWGSNEFASETSLDGYFTTPAGHVGGSGLPGGVTFVASSGDGGAWSGPEWPASSPNVLAVGGTSLYLTPSNNYGSESTWTYGGGGYSQVEWEPSFQRGAQNSGWRTTPDVSYDANPYTGVVTYNSFALQSGQSGWWISGGTSAGAPQWAGILALADQARAVRGLGSLGAAQQTIYGLSASDFHDITTGSNGWPAAVGYDEATGRGTPIVNLIVPALAGVGSPTPNSASRKSATGKAVIIEVVTGLPGPGGGTATQPGPAVSAAHPDLVPGLPTPAFPALLPADAVGDAFRFGWALSPTPSQPAAPANPPVQPVSPATDQAFTILGSTYGKAADSLWAIAPPWHYSPNSEDLTPELTRSLLLGQAEETPLADGEESGAAEAAVAEGADA
jgi:subtilase family serine protease